MNTGRRLGKVRVSNELIRQVFCLPDNATIRRGYTEEDHDNETTFLIECPDFPEVPLGVVPQRLLPRFSAEIRDTPLADGLIIRERIVRMDSWGQENEHEQECDQPVHVGILGVSQPASE